MAGDVRVDLDKHAIAELDSDDAAEDLAQDVGDRVASRARHLAPKRTGEGAASIHAETDVDDESAYADVSWDKDHYYMYFQEVGTEKMPAHPFLRPALDQVSLR